MQIDLGLDIFFWHNGIVITVFRRMSRIIWILAAFASCYAEARQQGTLPVGEQEAPGVNLPPASVSCEFDKVIAYNGIVTDYRRTTTSIKVTISTDRGTDETITIHQKDGIFAPYFLLFNRDFREPDWLLIEADTNQVIAGVRATAWICLDGETPPVIDWQPGIAHPGGRRSEGNQP